MTQPCTVRRFQARNPLTSAIFYSASALHAVQSAALARAILYVRHSRHVPVFVQANKDTIVRFSTSGRTILLVYGEVKFIRIFAGDHPQRGR